MATVDEEHYLRASLLLLKGTLFIVRKVLAREEQKEINNSGRVLDDLLQVHKRKLEHEFRNRGQRQKLFPANGKTNVEDWDISLLTGVLLVVFRNSLSVNERRALKYIKYQRNEEFAHRAKVEMPLDDFNDVTDDLTFAFDTLASEFDSETGEKCKAIKEYCLKGPLDIRSEIESIKRVSDTDDMFREILRNIEGTVERTTKNTKTTLKDENISLEKDISEHKLNTQSTICRTIKDCQLTKSELTALVKNLRQPLQQEKYLRQVEDSELKVETIVIVDDRLTIDMAVKMLRALMNEAIRRKETASKMLKIIKQQFRDETSSQTGVKALEAVTGVLTEKKEEQIDKSKQSESRSEKNVQSTFEGDSTDVATEKKQEQINKSEAAENMSEKNIQNAAEGDSTDLETNGILGNTVEQNSKSFEDLLDRQKIDKCCSTEGRTSPHLLKECDKICSFIKGMSNDIIHVWPAYKIDDETAVTFVVFASTNVSLGDLPWVIRVRILGQNNDKSKLLLHTEETQTLSTEMSRKCSTVIDKHSVDLMKKHMFISGISASSIMYKRNEAGDRIIVSEPCIVVYVFVEEYMPLSESKYPETLEGIPVDVREGDFRFSVGPADEFQDRLCMGCKISSSLKSFTLGGFIEHMEYGLCGITCAHGFLNDEQLWTLAEEKVLKENQFQLVLGGTSPIYTFQPIEGDNTIIGRLVMLILKEGGGDAAGVDLAIFTIDNRSPSAACFPYENGLHSDLTFNSGNVLGKLGIPAEAPVQKFGYVTKKTVGTVQFDNLVIRGKPFSRKLQDENFPSVTLYKQLHIKPNDVIFCDRGDSGALVFIEDQQQELRCIGMLVGYFEDNTAAVTPITDILKELGVSSFVSFKPSVLLENMNRHFEEMRLYLLDMERRLFTAINSNRQ